MENTLWLTPGCIKFQANIIGCSQSVGSGYSFWGSTTIAPVQIHCFIAGMKKQWGLNKRTGNKLIKKNNKLVKLMVIFLSEGKKVHHLQTLVQNRGLQSRLGLEGRHPGCVFSKALPVTNHLKVHMVYKYSACVLYCRLKIFRAQKICIINHMAQFYNPRIQIGL